jgi:signal transduction histidine kinase
VVGLYRTSTISAQLDKLLDQQLMPRGLTVEARRPGESGDRDGELLSVSLGPALPGWRLAMETSGSDLFEQAASERRALLAWVAATLVGLTVVMTWAVAAGVRRQMQVARLKNDLVATVSHELKTPLASIRLLIDSLLDEGDAANGAEAVDGKTREYLHMIAHENTRLTRLIDNFLTFSRMERRKHQFNLEPVDVRDILAQATAAVADRYNASDARLNVEFESGPDSELWVRGDIDALVTAVVNLLDNAWKYGGDAKQVRMAARREGDRALITVEDKGVGLTPRAARRVFERFYQVDQRLARTHGGCGLGLSIVRYIVEAHGGEATVESRVGEGCRFTLALPLDGEAASREGSDWSLKRPVRRGEGLA